MSSSAVVKCSRSLLIIKWINFWCVVTRKHLKHAAAKFHFRSRTNHLFSLLLHLCFIHIIRYRSLSSFIVTLIYMLVLQHTGRLYFIVYQKYGSSPSMMEVGAKYVTFLKPDESDRKSDMEREKKDPVNLKIRSDAQIDLHSKIFVMENGVETGYDMCEAGLGTTGKACLCVRMSKSMFGSLNQFRIFRKTINRCLKIFSMHSD